MCGRYALYASESEICSHFHLKRGFSMRSRYNIAPTQTIPVLYEWSKQIEFSRWGFIPSWTKSAEKLPSGYVNARMESILDRPTFKYAIKQHRCLIPASGYYEWRDIAGKKYPHFIYLKNQSLMGLAGLISHWKSPSHQVFSTCAIITTQAIQSLQNYHDRMPLIIAPVNYELWLSPTRGDELLEKMLNNSDLQEFNIHPVSAQMNNPQFEGAACIHAL